MPQIIEQHRAWRLSACPVGAEGAAASGAALARRVYAMILAGGRGSRLRQLTDWRAKPAMPFAGSLRIIDFPLSNCINSGVRRIGVATQYMAHGLIHHIQRGWNFLDDQFDEFIDVLPAQQHARGSCYLGTADAVFQNINLMRISEPEHVLILAGDHVYKMDYGVLLADHVAKGADATVACVVVPLEDARAFGVLVVDANWRVVDFQEKPDRPTPIPGWPGHALASMGIYAFRAGFLYDVLTRDHADAASGHDFGADVLPALARGGTLYAHCFRDSCVNMVGDTPYWRDVGTVDAYWEANMDLVQVTPDLNLYDDNWPIRTHLAQLPPAKFVFNDDGFRGHAVDSMVAHGCIVSGSSIERSLLSLKVRVRERGLIQDSVILPQVEIGRRVRLRRAVVDKLCVLPDDFAAGYDEQADRRRFHVTARGVTLITPEMLGQTVHQAR
ncbi:MAG: glgC [bacterium]|nr:MAG: glgC [bacterium]KAF0148127.1 MAG: glgC [bacterium]KAF0167607.1 MAG: glgC [bacterium]TXT17737.1 MAG: glgC [bacterium]